MKEFFVGLMLLLAFMVLSLVGLLLYPLLLVLGFFLQILFVIFLLIFAIWLLGKVALLAQQRFTRPGNKPPST